MYNNLYGCFIRTARKILARLVYFLQDGFYWVKSISVTNNIFLHKSAHYSYANTFIYITNVAGYIAIGLFSSYQREAASALLHACHYSAL